MTHSSDDRLDEVNLTVNAAGALAKDPEAFVRALEAFRAEDAEGFQSEMAKADLLSHCHRICHWFCSKHCIAVCRKLAGPIEGHGEFDLDEVLQFTIAMQALAADQELLAALVKAVDDVDAETFQALLKRAGIDPRYWHQLCHWLHVVKCRLKCKKLCPKLPRITHVGLIPVGQINAAGYAAGHSAPNGPTPADNKSPGPMGDHAFGLMTNIQGYLGVANPKDYKVETRPVAGGPWTPMLNPVDDTDSMGIPFLRYPTPTPPWFPVSAFGTQTSVMSNWWTLQDPDGLYEIRLTVRNSANVEFHSAGVVALTDNTYPADFSFTITQNGEKLPCCGSKVTRDLGPLEITITGWDANFASMSVTLRGGCNKSYPVFSKTYDGDITDLGAPPSAPVTTLYDPWAAGVEPCCYVLEIVMQDRAIVNNTVWAAHTVSAVRSITIA